MPGSDLTITIDQTDAATVVTLAGEIDTENAALVDARLAQVIGDGTAAPARVVLEMSGVSFIGSQGLDVLARHRRRLGDDTEIILQNPSAHLQRLLQITALDGLFSIQIEPG